MKKQKMRAGAVLAAAALALALVVPAGTEAADVKVDGTGTTSSNSTTGLYDGQTDAALNNATSTKDVQAKVSGGSEIVYDLDITWGAMQFEYDYGATWSPSTHSYTAGSSGNQDGGWVTANVDGAKNKISLVNNSNFPMKADFSYTPDTTLNATPATTGAVTGIFSTVNTNLNTAAVLALGKNGSGVSAMETGTLILQMDKTNLTTAGTTYYYYGGTGYTDDGDYDKDMFFALTGKPDAGGPSTYTSVGSISVAIAPCTGVTKATIAAAP